MCPFSPIPQRLRTGPILDLERLGAHGFLAPTSPYFKQSNFQPEICYKIIELEGIMKAQYHIRLLVTPFECIWQIYTYIMHITAHSVVHYGYNPCWVLQSSDVQYAWFMSFISKSLQWNFYLSALRPHEFTGQLYLFAMIATKSGISSLFNTCFEVNDETMSGWSLEGSTALWMIRKRPFWVVAICSQPFISLWWKMKWFSFDVGWRKCWNSAFDLKPHAKTIKNSSER